MVQSAIVRIVVFCTQHCRAVLLAGAVLSVGCAGYAATHFAITTDTERLLPKDLPWRKNQLAYQAEFPQGQITAVIEAATPEMTQLAATRLAGALEQDHAHFSWVVLPQGGTTLEHAALLYLPSDQLYALAGRLAAVKPLIGALVADPTLRGVVNAITVAIQSADRSHIPPALVPPMDELSATLSNVFAGSFASVSWQGLMTGKPATSEQLRQYIEIAPKLDFAALQPGHAATDAIRRAASNLGLGTTYGATLRLTGQVPINDEAFVDLRAGALPQAAAVVGVVLVILWLALRSFRIILSVFATLFAGFAVTAAAGLFMLGPFNLISISFAVLFVGLGADFGIQFSVRYRSERHDRDEVHAALRSAAEKSGSPLALAALSTAVGFFCFVPTNYRGVAALGQIAGLGMLIAFLATVTLLPALLTLAKPPHEARPMGFSSLAPVDRFLSRHRIAFVVGTMILVLAGTPLLRDIRFDFDPVHLQSQSGEAVRTLRELSRVPAAGMEAADVIVPSVAAIGPLSQKVERLPEVAGTRSIESLIPQDQDYKLALIRWLAARVAPDIHPAVTRRPPSDAQTVEALRTAAGQLKALAAKNAGAAAAAARQLSGLLDRLAGADAAMRDKAQQAIVVPLRLDLDALRAMLAPQRVTVASLPPALARQWLTRDGKARVEILPKGDANNTATVRRFAKAVLHAAPDATGTPIALIESEVLVLWAFIEAAIFAIVAIAIILWLALRRVGDVLLTLVPLMLAATATMELTVLIGEPLNFANVTALPLLLGVGVAFKIYYITAWRAGRTNLLQSTLTRAVFFSALTTATAFGSLWLSSQPGMSSMGELMALALACTLFAAVLFQPALMGPPRRQAGANAAPLRRGGEVL